jgi:uncharacterized protein (DUF849 family)
MMSTAANPIARDQPGGSWHIGFVIQRIKACLNGGRAFPAAPADLAREAAGAVAAGAEAIHLHPRDAAGRESLHAADVGAALIAVRAACPGIPVGVSTGLWITAGDAHRRAALIAGWRELPDFASVNVHEEGFTDLVRLLASMQVGVEAGVWAPDEVDALARLPLLRVLIEVVGTPAARAVPAADAILGRLDAAVTAASACCTARRTPAGR